MNDVDALAGIGLLLVRPGMIVLVAPFFGAMQAPPVVRAGITLILGLILAASVPVPAVPSAAALVVVVTREIAIGLALALAIRTLVFAAEFAGQFMGVVVGLSLGSLIDPQTGVRNNMLALMYAGAATLVGFGLNLHHALLRALVDSYTRLPVGLGGIDDTLPGSVAGLFGLVVVLGVRIAMPVIIALLVVEVSLGLLARVAPALNVMIAGLPVRLAIGLLVAAATLPLLPTLISRVVPDAFELALQTAGAFR